MEKRIYEIDGANSSTLEEFASDFTRQLNLQTNWRGNLDAFNDILHGGFGTPENGFVLVWKNMTPANYISILLSLLAICGFAAAQNVPDAQALDDGRQWLDSRSLPTPTAPALVQRRTAMRCICVRPSACRRT